MIINGTDRLTAAPGRGDVATDTELRFEDTMTGSQVAFSRYGASYLVEFACKGTAAITADGCHRRRGGQNSGPRLTTRGDKVMRIRVGLIAVGVLALSACDVIRVPGDGRAPPGPAPVIPEGAPGPQPPMVPVNDPYNEGDLEPIPAVDEDDATDTPTVPENDPIEDPVAPTDNEDDTPPVETPVPALPEPEPEPEPLPIKFQYFAPGSLTPGSGIGTPDETVYAPEIIFPIKDAAAFPQSQVWRFGGGIGGGDQCDARNFEVPWQDNFCEQRSRTRNTPLCPTNKVHQGQDIRIGTPEGCNQLRRANAADRTLYEAVAVEDGIIQYIGGYYIQLKGTEFWQYLQLHPPEYGSARGRSE